MLGYRKYSIILLIILIGVIFRLTNYINGSEMVDLIKVSVTGFFASNLVSKLAKYIQDKIKK